MVGEYKPPLEALLTVLFLVMIFASSGCIGSEGLYADKDTDTLELVPEELSDTEVTEVVHVDGSFFDDDRTERLMTSSLERSKESAGSEYDGPADYEEFLEEGGSNLPRYSDVEEATLVRAMEWKDVGTARSIEAAIVVSDWTLENASSSVINPNPPPEDLVEDIPDIDEEDIRHPGEPKEYRGVEIHADTREAVAHIEEENLFIIAKEKDVERMIDLYMGDGDVEPLSGDIRDRIDTLAEEPRPISFAGELHSFTFAEEFDEGSGHLTSGEVYYEDDELHVDASIQQDSMEEARQTESRLNRMVTALSEQDRARQFAANIDVTHQENAVEIRYTVEIDEGLGWL